VVQFFLRWGLSYVDPDTGKPVKEPTKEYSYGPLIPGEIHCRQIGRLNDAPRMLATGKVDLEWSTDRARRGTTREVDFPRFAQSSLEKARVKAT
jgi:hypothetical protein